MTDVRTPEEFASEHLKKAVNINWFDKDFGKHAKLLAKQNTVYVNCKKGGRSTTAVHVLDALGYSHIVDLRGYNALKNNEIMY